MCKSANSASVFDLVDTGSVCCREHARTEPSFVYIYEAEEPHTKKVCGGEENIRVVAHTPAQLNLIHGKTGSGSAGR